LSAKTGKKGRKICTIVGARPQFIKIAPLSREIRKSFREVLIHTGQHYSAFMSDVFFKEMNIPEPDYNLNIGSGNHGEQTGQMLIEIEKVLLNENPDLVIVFGDTNSTLAGALAAAKLHIPLVHIEAGLRSFNMNMPEEINRIVTDRISDFLFVPSKEAIKNLRNEGISKNVFNVGDIMYDSILMFKEIETMQSSKININGNEYLLATIHRAENTDKKARLKKIFDALNSLNKNVIVPLHPRTKKAIEKANIKIKSNISIIEPVGYFEMMTLLSNAHAVLTDSGGLQKEAYYLKIPCITLRDETEWVETVNTGWNTLAGADKDLITAAVNNADKVRKTRHPNLYGKGNTAELITGILKKNI